MPTLSLIKGFEDGVATLTANGGGLWSSITGTPTVQSSVVRTGSYALEVSPSGAAERCGQDFTATNVVVWTLYIRFASLPGADCQLLSITPSADTNRGSINFDFASSKLKAKFDDVSSTTALSGVITTGVWYRLDMRCTYNVNPRTLEWMVDGVAQTTVTLATATGQSNGQRFGTVNADTYQCYYDDSVISFVAADYPIGAVAVEAIRPTSDGTHNAGVNIMEDQAGTDIGTAAAWSLIDDVPITSATEYIRQAANGTGNYAEVLFGNPTLAHSQVLGALAILAYTAATTTLCTGGCIVSKDSFSTQTTVWGASGALADYSDGSTGSPWYKSVMIAGVIDKATVENLKARMGYSDDANPDPYWINIMVEVALLQNLQRKQLPTVLQALNRGAVI